MAVDVTVLGAGVFGLSIAFHCLRRGASVRVIDPNGVASGASGGIVGALAPHTPDNWNTKKQFQFESLIQARDFWPLVSEISGQTTGYTHAGRITPILEDRHIPLALTRAEAAEVNWKDLARWEVVTRKSLDHWSPPSATGHFIRDDLSAHIHPRQATWALAKAVEHLGGIITDKGAVQGKVIEATGWRGLMDLSADLDKSVGNGVKGQAALLDFPANGRPQMFADGLHIVPHSDGTVAIGSTSERDFKSPDKTDGQLDDIVAKAKQLFPILKDAEVIARWAGVRPRAKSRAPMLGHHPVRAGRFIANGGFKIGFGMAPKVGEVMADLVLEGTTTIPEAFNVEANL